MSISAQVLRSRQSLEQVLDTFASADSECVLALQRRGRSAPSPGALQAKGWTTALPHVVGPRKPLEFHKLDRRCGNGCRRLRHSRAAHARTRAPRYHRHAAGGLRFGELPARIWSAATSTSRWFDWIPVPARSAWASSFTRLDTIHPLPTDIPMDLVITEAGIQKNVPWE